MQYTAEHARPVHPTHELCERTCRLVPPQAIRTCPRVGHIAQPLTAKLVGIARAGGRSVLLQQGPNSTWQVWSSSRRPGISRVGG